MVCRPGDVSGQVDVDVEVEVEGRWRVGECLAYLGGSLGEDFVLL